MSADCPEERWEAPDDAGPLVVLEPTSVAFDDGAAVTTRRAKDGGVTSRISFSGSGTYSYADGRPGARPFTVSGTAEFTRETVTVTYDGVAASR